MKRAARLLLLLLFSLWLWALPGARLPRLAHVERAPAVSEQRVQSQVEHVAPGSASAQLAKAPLLARLQAPPAFCERAPFSELPRPTRLADRRAALRRVQVRRRLPRLPTGDPPWP